MFKLLSATNDFIIIDSGAATIQIVLHIITVIISLGLFVLGIYILVLLVKYLRRGIKYFNIKISEVEKTKED